MFGSSMFESSLPARRDARLKEAKSNVKRVSRDLGRDRNDVERTERALLGQIRMLVQRGEIPRARIIASQVAHYRMLADRNFGAAAMIQTRAQVAASNHKINRAEIDALKCMSYSNFEESLTTVQRREAKYAERMEMFETMESIMNEGMDEIYGEPEVSRKAGANEKLSGTFDGPNTPSFDREIDAVIRQAIEPGLRREYIGSGKASDDRKSVQVKAYTPDFDEFAPSCTVSIPTLDISTSMLTHLIRSDAVCIKSLGLGTHSRANYDAALGTAKGLRVGVLLGRRWVPLAPDASLRESGISEGGVVYVEVIGGPTSL
ncbi:hypothetical protein SmJEL517_g04054 [Synchytrium microbalum]|uniref:Uncharacterized protein n=1 Tax=Synchytrium microbalum TaxID=1806994 RepID=A0A507C5W6_9FUNG|nr:uncharacterized protein SmJEL517_g04054 [Synchytrium microbalum]TPX32865.1 hypothetical protein SmJEL517_g04054 [Synchytrium microbalum]